MMRGCDAVLAQRVAVADAGKHQQVRALKRRGGKDHFAAGANLFCLLALAVVDADRALPSNRMRVACAWVSTRRFAAGLP